VSLKKCLFAGLQVANWKKAVHRSLGWTTDGHNAHSGSDVSVATRKEGKQYISADSGSCQSNDKNAVMKNGSECSHATNIITVGAICLIVGFLVGSSRHG
jgi:hypothetical protein